MRKHLAFLLVLVMVLTVAAIPAYAEGEEKVLNLASESDILTLDVAQTTDDYFIPHNVFDRLFEIKVNPDGGTDIVPSLVADYSVSDDGLTYSFTLVDGVEFSNGNPLTAEDVKYTFEHLLTAPKACNYDIAEEVVGAQALLDGEAEELEGIVVEDDTHFTLTLVAANAGYIAELTSPAMSIIDKETVESVGDFGTDPAGTIGSGPYIVSEWVPNDHFTLTRNENYWGEAPDADVVVMNVVPDANTQNLMFQNGELDIIDLDALDSSIIDSVYKTTYADSIVPGYRVGVTFMSMNENNEFLSDVNVRKAVQMAINRQSLLDNFYGGDGIIQNGMIATGVWGHNDDLEPINYDSEGAKALLAEAGYEEGEITFEFSMDSSSGDTTAMVYQQIAQDLAAVGITAEIKSYDESAWLDFRKTEEMPAFLGTWTMDYNDPANILGTFFSNSTSGRSLNYANQEIKDRVDAASSIINDEERMAEYQAIEHAIVVEDAAVVPLYERAHLFCIGEKVASFVPHWAGFSNFFVRDVEMN